MKQGQTEKLESTVEVFDGRMKQGQTEKLESTVEVCDGRMKQGPDRDTGKYCRGLRMVG